MVVERGSVWWAEVGEPRGSQPGYRRPVLIVQSDAFNRSRIQTVIAVVLTSNLALLDAPGNVLVTTKASGLPKDSVANVSQVITLDKDDLVSEEKHLDAKTMRSVAEGLRLVMDL